MTLQRSIFGIQGKTALLFFGVFISIILPVNYIIYTKVKQLLVNADTRELMAEGEKLFAQVRIDPPIVPLPAIGYTIFIQAANELQSDSIFASPNFPVQLNELRSQPVLEYDTFKIITLSRPVEYGRAQLFLSVGRSNRTQEDHVSELKAYLFAANLVSILIAGALVYIVAGFTLRPIKKIIRVAQNINAANSIERVPVPFSKDENRELAVTINDMLLRIENSIQNQTNFFASAAHELRTPLAVMKTELTLVKEEHRWHDLLREVERLERIVNDFLMISQLKSRSLSIRKKKVEIPELIYSCLKKVKYLSEEKKSKIRIDLQEHTDTVSIELDEDKMETVLVNLLENAIKYSVDNSSIQIVTRHQDEIEIEIRNPLTQSVSDPEKFKHEFVKAEAMSNGLGMGLWIANEIIGLHQGQLKLSSKNHIFSAKIILPGTHNHAV